MDSIGPGPGQYNVAGLSAKGMLTNLQHLWLQWESRCHWSPKHTDQYEKVRMNSKSLIYNFT